MKNLCAAAISGSGLVKWGHDSSWQHTHHNPLFWSSGQHRNTLGPVAEAERLHSGGGGGEQTLGEGVFFLFWFFFLRSGNDLWNAHLELYLKPFFASQARVCGEQRIGNILSPASIKRGNIYIGGGGYHLTSICTTKGQTDCHVWRGETYEWLRNMSVLQAKPNQFKSECLFVLCDLNVMGPRRQARWISHSP